MSARAMMLGVLAAAALCGPLAPAHARAQQASTPTAEAVRALEADLAEVGSLIDHGGSLSSASVWSRLEQHLIALPPATAADVLKRWGEHTSAGRVIAEQLLLKPHYAAGERQLSSLEEAVSRRDIAASRDAFARLQAVCARMVEDSPKFQASADDLHERALAILKRANLLDEIAHISAVTPSAAPEGSR